MIIAVVQRVRPAQLAEIFRTTFSQMWGALLVAPIIFGLATVFNYSGMASTLAFGFSRVGTWFILLAPLLGWIGVALSGSNTSTNALFGGFQYAVGGLLHMPLLLLPSLNSVGAEVGKPIAPQTTSADRHNSAMANGCGLSHQCPGEPPLGDRETDAGVNWSIAGENVGEGGQVPDSPDAIAHMAKELTSAMLNERPPDDGHRKNILSSSFTHIGIAVFSDSSGTVWLTQDFAN